MDHNQNILSISGICTITVPDVVHTTICHGFNQCPPFFRASLKIQVVVISRGFVTQRTQIVFALHLNMAVVGRLAAAPPFMLWSLPIPTEIKEACQHIRD